MRSSLRLSMLRNPATPAVWRATVPILAVHGGAGRIAPEVLSAQRAAEAKRGLGESLTAGMAVLGDGGTALDAAVADGATRRAGAVTCVSGIRNPVLAARAVLERTPHVLMSGAGAHALARREGLAFASNDWFVTTRREQQLAGALPSDGAEEWSEGETVGAVALDGQGHLAAATSTGGITGQLAGRVGDTPLIGAGTWADDRTCAVSATGDGEALILSVFAHEVDALVRLAGLSLGAACYQALHEVETRTGTGGCIAVAPDGTVAMPFTSSGMFRGAVDATGVRKIGVFAKDLTEY